MMGNGSKLCVIDVWQQGQRTGYMCYHTTARAQQVVVVMIVCQCVATRRITVYFFEHSRRDKGVHVSIDRRGIDIGL